LGLLQLRSALFKAADRHLSRAEELGLLEASYYRGVIALFEGRLTAAQEHFTSAQNAASHSAAALMGLGQVALRQKNWERAIDFFEQASQQTDRAFAPVVLLAIALRHAGKQEEAYAELQRVLAQDPLSHPAFYEMASADHPESRSFQEKLQRLLSDDEQYFMDLACYYVDAGLPGDGLEVLKTAWLHKETAMTAYLAAFFSHQTGDTTVESSWLEKARAASPELGFPSRLEEVLALQFALETDPQDSKAKYFLGNFYYAHERYDEAIQLWTEALTHMERYDVLLRNLGLAAWQRKQNPTEAIQWFEKALSLNPHNQDLYLNLDELYKSLALAGQRARLLEKMDSLSDVREDVRKHRIKMMVELGHYRPALEIMTTEKFIPLEMDQSFHEVYVQALMLQANDHMKTGRMEEAIQDYNRMLEYPENHGVGAPTRRAQAHIYYHLGLAHEKLGQYKKAIKAWRAAASEHHPHGKELFAYVQRSLDKLSRYSDLGLED
jgi:tetratricopeptide (TPR) repeat protein